MFTGIVETIGTVKAWQQGGDTCQITIAIGSTWSDLHLGDSVAVNGVCLTAAALGEDWFRADVLVESLRRTSLAHLRPGVQVNLERALPVGGRLGGHFVTGHIDGVGRIQYHQGTQLSLVQDTVAHGCHVLVGTQREYCSRWYELNHCGVRSGLVYGVSHSSYGFRYRAGRPSDGR